MKTATPTKFEAYVNELREAQAKAAGGYGTTLPYPADVLEGTNTDFDVAISQARALLQKRQDQVEALACWLNLVDKCIADGGKEEYIAEIERIYSK
jgi:hypothetical protein